MTSPASSAFPWARPITSSASRSRPRSTAATPKSGPCTPPLRAPRAGARELVLVAGPAGIGKSVLIKELHASIAAARSSFIEGKFDQYRHVPYSALAHALSQLIGQLLAEPEERLAAWRLALRDTLGPGGQVLVDVIPALTFLIGPQPPVPRLDPAETESRFHLAFQRLDDLQWADAASLRLVTLVLTDPQVSHLLIIGACRDDELDAAHPLHPILDRVAAAARIERITLVPLAIGQVVQILADTLQRGPADCAELAALIIAKTAGNPFFVTQFLRTLHQDRLLAFDRGLRGWRWDLDAIQALGITDNVVDLMLDRMRRLPAPTQRALQMAACTGSAFDLETLAILCETSPAQLHGELLPAMDSELVQPLPRLALGTGDSMNARVFPPHGFAHDRIRQAAYALIPAPDRIAAHLRIARLLERARVRGDVPAAMTHYSAAITGARAHDYLREEAMACERAASFYGAQAKARALETQHPWLGQRASWAPPGTTTRSSTGATQMLDFESVLRASQALSSQLVLDTLLAQLMKFIVENAGAQRGYLLLVRDGALTVEAGATSTPAPFAPCPRCPWMRTSGSPTPW